VSGRVFLSMQELVADTHFLYSWGAKTDAWDKEATAAIEAGATHVLG
jgi:hypothetical protein